MKFIKILIIIILLLGLALFIFSLVPHSRYEDHSEKDFCSFPTAYPTSWQGREFYTTGGFDTKLIDTLISKFSESGLSETYIKDNLKLIVTDTRGQKIDAWFLLTTNSWLDTHGPAGIFLPMGKDSSGKQVCKPHVGFVHASINPNFAEDSSIIVYSVGKKIWHNGIVVKNDIPFKQIENVMSPWRAGLIAKKCLPFSRNTYSVYLNDQLTFEYVVNGKNMETLFDDDHYMQARVDLVTGEMSCKKEQNIIYMVPSK